MKRSLRILILLVLVPLIDIAGTAQEPDARTVLQAALKAMGGENLRSIQYSGNEGYVAAVGQNYNPAARLAGALRSPPTRARSTTRRDPPGKSTG